MKWIDLTHTLDEKTPGYPGDPPLRLKQDKTLEGDGYNAWKLETGFHVGTHIDAPMHLLPDVRGINAFPPDRFAGPGVLLNVQGESPIGMKREYEWQVMEDSIVLLYTGFSRFYNRPEYYFSQHPELTVELAEFLVGKKVKILGMDMPSPDHPPYRIHKLLLQNDVFILENLCRLEDLLDATEFEVMAFPLKIAAEGSLVRAVARVK